MIIKPSKDQELIKTIITDPTLWKLEYGQGMSIEDFEVDQSYDYLLIGEDNKVLGCFQTRSFTRVIMEAHIYLLPEYWGKDYSKRALQALFEYTKKETAYRKVITDVPKVCKHVIGLMKKIGATQCGYITDGVVYNNKLTDLMLFTKDVRG